jgi:hypothetical protein
VDLRVQAQADVGARLRAVLAADQVVRAGVAADARFVFGAELELRRGSAFRLVAIVRRARPQRFARNIDAAEREMMEELGAKAEEAMDLDDRPRVRPPLAGVDLGLVVHRRRRPRLVAFAQ